MKQILIPAVIILSSCATTPVVVELPLPPELVLPKVTGSLDCIAQEDYDILVKRDKLQAERRKTLRSIIETTRKQ